MAFRIMRQERMPRSGPPPPNIGRAPERRHSEAPAHRAIASGNIAAARRRRYRRAGAGGFRFLPSPLLFSPPPFQGGGREGGPAAGSAGVPPASREARTRVRAFGPPSRRDAGAPRQFTDERGRESPRPSGCSPGSTPLPTFPLPGGGAQPGGRANGRDAGPGGGSPPPSLLPPSRGEERRDFVIVRRRRGRSHGGDDGDGRAGPGPSAGARARSRGAAPPAGAR